MCWCCVMVCGCYVRMLWVRNWSFVRCDSWKVLTVVFGRHGHSMHCSGLQTSGTWCSCANNATKSLQAKLWPRKPRNMLYCIFITRNCVVFVWLVFFPVPTPTYVWPVDICPSIIALVPSLLLPNYWMDPKTMCLRRTPTKQERKLTTKRRDGATPFARVFYPPSNLNKRLAAKLGESYILHSYVTFALS